MYPVKILDDLYVLGVANPSGNEKEEFLKLSEIDKMEILISKKPEVRQSKSENINRKFYTPSFGNFIVSTSEKEFIKFYNLEFTQKESEELFSRFHKEYLNMLSCYEKLGRFIYSNNTL